MIMLLQFPREDLNEFFNTEHVKYAEAFTNFQYIYVLYIGTTN